MCAIHGYVENIVFEGNGCANTLDLVDGSMETHRNRLSQMQNYTLMFLCKSIKRTMHKHKTCMQAGNLLNYSK
jgi:hypothetical protein